LLIQLAALLSVIALLLCLKVIAGIVQPVFVWAIVLGMLAAALSLWCSMDWWWVAIELLFAPTLLAANTLPIPPAIFLALFLLLLGIFWSTCRTQVPLFLSGPIVWDAVDRLLPHQPLRFVDIGSGLGGLVLALAQRRPDCTLYGVEIAPLPWLISVLRARWMNSAAFFARSDYRALDFADYDVIFAYLSPAAMPALWQQAVEQMGDGSMLISYQFGLASIPPDHVGQLEGNNTRLYIWYPAAHRHVSEVSNPRIATV
jgi:SAM-dependent methyltransferase